MKHKSGKLNQGADALSRPHLLLFRLDACGLGFEHLKSLYASDEDFSELSSTCLEHPRGFSYSRWAPFQGYKIMHR